MESTEKVDSQSMFSLDQGRTYDGQITSALRKGNLIWSTSIINTPPYYIL